MKLASDCRLRSNVPTTQARRPKSIAGSGDEAVAVPGRGREGVTVRRPLSRGPETLQNRSRMAVSSYVSIRKQVLALERKQNPRVGVKVWKEWSKT